MNVKIKFTEQSQTVAELKQEISHLQTKVVLSNLVYGFSMLTLICLLFKNSEMLAEENIGRANLDDSDRVRDLQDKVAELKAEVSACYWDMILV